MGKPTYSVEDVNLLIAIINDDTLSADNVADNVSRLLEIKRTVEKEAHLYDYYERMVILMTLYKISRNKLIPQIDSLNNYAD